MASTRGSLRQRLALRSASAQLTTHSAWLQAADALGPELARRVRGEVDHDAVRVDVPHAAALVHLAGGIGGLELDPHHYSVMKWPAALTHNVSCRWLTWPAHELRRPTGKLLRFLFALPSVRDLLLWVKHLFVEAMSGNYPRRGGGEW